MRALGHIPKIGGQNGARVDRMHSGMRNRAILPSSDIACRQNEGVRQRTLVPIDRDEAVCVQFETRVAQPVRRSCGERRDDHVDPLEPIRPGQQRAMLKPRIFLDQGDALPGQFLSRQATHAC